MVKKKIVMRVASLALCVVFTASVFGAPKAKAVAAETAIGVAVVAAYFAATGLALSASAGSTGELVTTGVGKIVTDFCAAVDHAGQTATDFYATLVANTNIRPDGALALSAAAVVAIGELVEWYVGENGLEAEGDTAVAVPGTSDFYSYNGNVRPAFPSIDSEVYPFCFFFTDSTGTYTTFSSSNPYVDGKYVYNAGPFTLKKYFYNGVDWILKSDYTEESPLVSYGKKDSILWCSSDIFYKDSDTVAIESTAPVPVGDNIQNQLEVARAPEFTQPDTELQPESKKQMVIDLGLTPGITLDEAVVEIPDRIAVGTLAPTYEITSTETVEGTTPDEGADSDDLVYVPMLERIQNAITGLGDTIVDGIMDGLASLFVPSEAYLEALPAQITDTFDERTGFLTYPFSLLPDFVGRLSAPSDDWILKWPQIAEPFTGTILFQQGSWNVTAFVQANAQIKQLYDLWRLIAKALMSFGFIGLCYNKYRSVVGDRYGEG